MPGNDHVWKAILDSIEDGVVLSDPERRITSWNRATARITGFTAEEVINVPCDRILACLNENGAPLCGSKECPLRDAKPDDAGCQSELYVHHKEGYRVAVVVRASIIRSEQGEAAGFVTLLSDHQLAVRGGEFQKLSKMALLDPISLAFSKPHGELRLHARLDEMRRYYAGFGVLLLGIDRFKDFCASYGGQAGSRVLKSVAKTLANGLRGSDVVSRWAGEHFLIILLRVDDGELAAVANRLLRLVKGCAFSVGDRQISVTVSIGATVAQREDTMDTLVERAGDLMHRSSATGGNRVTVQAGP